MKRVLINGAPRETTASTVADLVAELGFAKGMVLVEHNGIALQPDEWSGLPVAAGDRVELMRMVAGG
ncbi:MAG: sulfur carrier protein ThiS [Chthoniobacteraceae bacterium]